MLWLAIADVQVLTSAALRHHSAVQLHAGSLQCWCMLTVGATTGTVGATTGLPQTCRYNQTGRVTVVSAGMRSLRLHNTGAARRKVSGYAVLVILPAMSAAATGADGPTGRSHLA